MGYSPWGRKESYTTQRLNNSIVVIIKYWLYPVFVQHILVAYFVHNSLYLLTQYLLIPYLNVALPSSPLLTGNHQFVLCESISFCYSHWFCFIHLFMAVLCLRGCRWAFSSLGGQWLLPRCSAQASFAAEPRLYGAQASVVAAHGLSCSMVCGLFLDQ